MPYALYLRTGARASRAAADSGRQCKPYALCLMPYTCERMPEQVEPQQIYAGKDCAQLLRCQYSYSCASKASKLSTSFDAIQYVVAHHPVPVLCVKHLQSVFVLLYQ